MVSFLFAHPGRVPCQFPGVTHLPPQAHCVPGSKRAEPCVFLSSHIGHSFGQSDCLRDTQGLFAGSVPAWDVLWFTAGKRQREVLSQKRNFWPRV